MDLTSINYHKKAFDDIAHFIKGEDGKELLSPEAPKSLTAVVIDDQIRLSWDGVPMFLQMKAKWSNALL